jgi:dTDP-4-amino-4,6-dideoxygalactose transaminase
VGTLQPVAEAAKACQAAGVPLLVDAAAGFGAEDAAGRKVGALGDVDVVSFHATKPFAVGEGGAVFTADPEIMAAMEGLANFGLDVSGRITRPHGLNAKMSELHAAVALAVLDDFDDILSTRRQASAEVAAHASGLAWQEESERSTWQFIPVAFADENARAEAVARSRDTVESRRYYRPLHQMERFADTPLGSGGLSATDDIANRLLCLPMANDLSPDEIDTVAAVLRGA